MDLNVILRCFKLKVPVKPFLINFKIAWAAAPFFSSHDHSVVKGQDTLARYFFNVWYQDIQDILPSDLDIVFLKIIQNSTDSFLHVSIGPYHISLHRIGRFPVVIPWLDELHSIKDRLQRLETAFVANVYSFDIKLLKSLYPHTLKIGQETYVVVSCLLHDVQCLQVRLFFKVDVVKIYNSSVQI